MFETTLNKAIVLWQSMKKNIALDIERSSEIQARIEAEKATQLAKLYSAPTNMKV